MTEEELEFKINPFLKLRLEDNQTIIYTGEQPFIQCKFLLLAAPKKSAKPNYLSSVDEATHHLDGRLEAHHNISAGQMGITPEQEFWGHSSSLQAWHESDYNTDLIHSNLALPLLKKLTKAGDPLAKKVFKQELQKKINEGHLRALVFFIKKNYLKYLEDEDIINLYDGIDKHKIKALTKKDELFAYEFVNTMVEKFYSDYLKKDIKIKTIDELIDKTIYRKLGLTKIKYEKSALLEIFNGFSNNLRENFIRDLYFFIRNKYNSKPRGHLKNIIKKLKKDLRKYGIEFLFQKNYNGKKIIYDNFTREVPKNVDKYLQEIRGGKFKAFMMNTEKREKIGLKVAKKFTMKVFLMFLILVGLNFLAYFLYVDPLIFTIYLIIDIILSIVLLFIIKKLLIGRGYIKRIFINREGF